MAAPLYVKYRPHRWEDVVAQPKAISTLERLRRGPGLAGRAFWISGASGTGKTTLAHLIAREIAEDICIDEIDAGEASPTYLREREDTWRTWGFPPKGGRAYIINEAHGLRAPSIRQLLVMLERIPRHVAVVFTTTCVAAENMFETQLDAGPLLSRCIEIALAQRNLCIPFARRAQEIAQAEGLDGQPLARYETLLKDKHNNLRAALQTIEAGTMA